VSVNNWVVFSANKTSIRLFDFEFILFLFICFFTKKRMKTNTFNFPSLFCKIKNTISFELFDYLIQSVHKQTRIPTSLVHLKVF
jgi:hypothetical protein